jgi:hypothetical protein
VTSRRVQRLIRDKNLLIQPRVIPPIELGGTPLGLILTVSAPPLTMVTFEYMSKPQRTKIDSRLENRPRDYLDNPAAFGSRTPVRTYIPPGGDKRSLKIAWAQHQLAAKYNDMTSDDKMGTAQITEGYEFSVATWSRTLTGQRWAGLTGMVALLEAAGVWALVD